MTPIQYILITLIVLTALLWYYESKIVKLELRLLELEKASDLDTDPPFNLVEDRFSVLDGPPFGDYRDEDPFR